jgi:selenocysteine lyase/cysteine desulfurase
LVAWLSSFDLKNKPKIITTDGEFHSMSRQLRRLQEEGIKLNIVEAESDNIADQIASFANNRTSAIMLSRVYFKSGLINQHISEIAKIARTNDIPLLIDDYHGTNVAPLSLRDQNLEDCYLLIGGYKYLQWGEGNCFLRFPSDCRLRPAITGWFASFNTLEQPQNEQKVPYDEGNQRFASGTYDSASQFRAARVVEFFRDQRLTPTTLRQQYQAQISLLKRLFLDQNFDTDYIRLAHGKPVEQNGGFLALQSCHALELQKELVNQGVYTDARGDVLRIGPAPYITTSQIEQCIKMLVNSVKSLH